MKGIYCDGNLTCKTGDIVHYHTAILEGKSDDATVIAKTEWPHLAQSKVGTGVYFKNLIDDLLRIS